MSHSEYVTGHLAKAIESARAEANAAGTALGDLIATRDLIAADVDELARQAAWWEAHAPASDIGRFIATAHEERSRALSQASNRAMEAARKQQAHEQAAAELEKLAEVVAAEQAAEPGPVRTGPDAGPRADAVAVLVANGAQDTQAHPAVPVVSLACVQGHHDRCQDLHGSEWGACGCQSCSPGASAPAADVTRVDGEAGQ